MAFFFVNTVQANKSFYFFGKISKLVLILRAKAISDATQLQARTVCKNTVSLSDTQHSLEMSAARSERPN